MQTKCLLIFGTRPEAIKMAPLIQALKINSKEFLLKVCVTAQHREMLDQVLDFFEIVADYDLNLMVPGQNLFQLSSNVLLGLQPIIEDFQPDYVFVHGDTTTSTIGALAAFYSGAKVCHVEAGLRTNNKWSPFPEEMNRQITGRLTDIHFAPTSVSRQNLLNEGVNEDKIVVVGNTVIDALLWANEKLKSFKDKEIEELEKLINENKKIILVTGHRRENFGDGFVNICQALKEIAQRDDVQIIYPVHLNPNVQKPVYDILGDLENVNLIKPLSYPAFVWLMSKCYLILTDSGGVQEEAPSLGKPVLVMRDTTERPEAVDAGTVRLVGTDKDKILMNCVDLLENTESYKKMSQLNNPYGNGETSTLIINSLKNE